MVDQLQYTLDIPNEKLNDLNILITGGTGSFGHQMVHTLLTHFNPRRIVIFSRDEFKQAKMKELFSPKKYHNMRYFIGDVRDYERLETAFHGIDLVFHACALKRIQECEYDPMEAIKTNILGTKNVIRAAIKNNVKYVIGLSTDKACSPVNLYGATKLCMEKLLLNGNVLSSNATKFSVCRYGNVMGSRGSLFPIFNRLKQEGKPLTVTDPTMTRFNMLLDEAVNFVLLCYDLMVGGEIFIPKLPAYTIGQVADCYGSKDGEYQIVGARPGEKFHEMMISGDESHLAYKFDDFYILTPLEEHGIQYFNIDSYNRKFQNITRLDSHKPYSSKDAKKLSNERLRFLIKYIQDHPPLH